MKIGLPPRSRESPWNWLEIHPGFDSAMSLDATKCPGSSTTSYEVTPPWTTPRSEVILTWRSCSEASGTSFFGQDWAENPVENSGTTQTPCDPNTTKNNPARCPQETHSHNLDPPSSQFQSARALGGFCSQGGVLGVLWALGPCHPHQTKPPTCVEC